MKTGFLVAIMALAAAATSHAMQVRTPANTQLYTCARGGISHVSTLAARSEQCCDGKLQCPQFLATTTVLKPKHDPRT